MFYLPNGGRQRCLVSTPMEMFVLGKEGCFMDKEYSSVQTEGTSAKSTIPAVKTSMQRLL